VISLLYDPIPSADSLFLGSDACPWEIGQLFLATVSGGLGNRTIPLSLSLEERGGGKI
jgi:hypothetical protein